MSDFLAPLAECSQRYGGNPQFVFLGGGNTSYKNKTTLYIKPSGVSLASIRPSDFVHLDRALLRRVFEAPMPADSRQRETAVRQLMAAAVLPDSRGRASVEAPLHELLPYHYVVHTHPALVNGMTCGKNGSHHCSELFPEALWVDYRDPGYTLAITVKATLDQATRGNKPTPKLIFLQNHGLFVAADTIEEIDSLYLLVMERLHRFYQTAGISVDLPPASVDQHSLHQLAPTLRGICRAEDAGTVLMSSEPFKVATGPLTPDHIIYGRAFPFTGEADRAAIQAWRQRHGYPPKVFSFPETAVFTVGGNLQEARNRQLVARNGALIRHLAEACGGVRYLNDREYRFIEGWEAESYRSQVASATPPETAKSRMEKRVCLITGAAQGFGFEIARGLALEGAIVGLADLNREGAAKAAAELTRQTGEGQVFSLGVNVGDEDSVAAMISETVRLCGGLDLLVANAGVLKADSVKQMSLADWDLVTKVNYTGYFLCVKHASPVMATQNQAARDSGWSDIIQINSKSGLEGSRRNAAYAGSKFGCIGLTQSFAKELVEDRIKVNSVCPGNYFEGPLWSDPEKGLFVQYLKAGKVPDADSVDAVKAYYESRVPMGRGCHPEDVIKAILYLVEQDYETGQALPVGGGQVMLP